jgi:hypothetical protein
MLCIKFIICSLVLFKTLFVASQQDDDSVNYVGFHTAAVMPFARSDMTATTIVDASGETKIYLVGGCIADQVCDFTVSSDCYCPEITNKCTYFEPESNLWASCPAAPTYRSRHMGK